MKKWAIKRTLKEEDILFDARQKMTVTCHCGHRVLFQEQTDRLICSHCGYYCYRTPKLEFEYNLKESLRKNDKRRTR